MKIYKMHARCKFERGRSESNKNENLEEMMSPPGFGEMRLAAARIKKVMKKHKNFDSYREKTGGSIGGVVQQQYV